MSMQFSYPHTIDNGHGESLTFLSLIKDADGERLEVENRVKPGAGPPMHVHHLQDESLTVVQGRLAAQLPGEAPTFHGPGETILFKRGVPHRFWNAGEDDLICRGWISPPHNIVYFLTEIFASVKNSGSKRPSLFEGAYLQMRYKSEFDMVEIPTIVKTLVFPVVILFGKLTGKDKRFKDAPHAIS
jgi:quercetin dioxygenase-like cupin family protein